jgi:hypothetical protein
MDGKARVEVIERAEAGETLTDAQIKEIVDKAVIASREDVEAKVQRAGDEVDRRAVEQGADPNKVPVLLNRVEAPPLVMSAVPD